MRIVVDTNVVISGLLWFGAPRQVLNAARDHIIEIVSSTELIDEFKNVLNRKKFKARLDVVNVDIQDLVLGFSSLVTIIKKTDPIEKVIIDDPDDDYVLACAKTAKAKYIISGDNHLLNFKIYDDIEILTATDFITRMKLNDN